jgi:16S rRNA processing protein RimM
MTPEWDDLVTVGLIARPHGLRGQVIVNLETDFPEQRYRPGAELWVLRDGRAERLTVRDVRFHQGRPVVGFEGFDTIEAVEALGRGELRADPATFEPLPEGTYRHSDLVGCEVVTRAGTVVGPVKKVDGQFMSSCLVVQYGQREVMIPLAANICVEIDPAGRRIVVDPPEGLLDL